MDANRVTILFSSKELIYLPHAMLREITVLPLNKTHLRTSKELILVKDQNVSDALCKSFSAFDSPNNKVMADFNFLC